MSVMTLPPSDEPRDTGALIKELVLTILIPLAYPAGLVVMWMTPKQFGFGSDAIVYGGWAVGVSGLILWIGAMINLGKSLDVLPGADRLVRRGIYRFVRHPIYLGITMTFLGLVLCLGSLWGLGYLLAIVLPMNWVRARLEERTLEARFHEEYWAWRKATWF